MSRHLTLSPGPSQLSDSVKSDIRTAVDNGLLEISHRSSKFTDISRTCIEELRAYLDIPADYHIFYFDSASAVWHSMAANVVRKNAFALVNGAFSAKARESFSLLRKDTKSRANFGNPGNRTSSTW